MTKEKLELFRSLFGEYCAERMRSGACVPDTCEMCPVNGAIEMVFDGQEPD